MCLFPQHITVRPKDAQPYRAVVKCGKCLECFRQQSYEWAFRIVHECSKYERNAFVTLTYNDEHLPESGSVSRREVQLFMKRFRKAVSPLKVRFFACGEYGKKKKRPHYHVIIFGWFPDDAYFWQNDGKIKLYRSSFLEKVWTLGFSSVGSVSFDSALYCAKYMNKVQFYEKSPINRRLYVAGGMTLPFVQMSNRPGIGADFAYTADLVSDRIYIGGRSCKIPRYYLKLLEREGVYLDEFKERRIRDGEHRAQFVDLEAKREKVRRAFYGHKTDYSV